MSAKCPHNVCKMSACCLFSGVFECVIFTMDKEMRKTKNTSLGVDVNPLIIEKAIVIYEFKTRIDDLIWGEL